jgi:hypothetical protein
MNTGIRAVLVVRCRPLTVGLTGFETTCIWKGGGSGEMPRRRLADRPLTLNARGGYGCPKNLLIARLLGSLNYDMAISDSLGGEVKQDGE